MGIAEMDEERRMSCRQDQNHHRLGQGPDPEEELQTLSWYHDGLTRHAAEALLLSNGKDGSYLLRKIRAEGAYKQIYGPDGDTLRVGDFIPPRAKDSVKHFHIEYTGSSYKFGFNEFASLKDLIMHFANQPLIGSETGTLIVLKWPYPRQVEEPSIYESVRVHTAMQTGKTELDLVPSAPSLGTKEGYLTKQGWIVKNWKTRWFTLHRNELKYYKDQSSTEPIRSLDLTECKAVQFDYSQDKVNCFCSHFEDPFLAFSDDCALLMRAKGFIQLVHLFFKSQARFLVFPLRTYYMYAKTGVEADEWIKILQWKLSQIRKQAHERDGTLRP